MVKPTLDYYVLHASEVAQRYEVAPSPLAHRFAESFPSGDRILDIGCGLGRDLAQLQFGLNLTLINIFLSCESQALI